jgi:hypothetical protein
VVGDAATAGSGGSGGGSGSGSGSSGGGGGGGAEGESSSGEARAVRPDTTPARATAPATAPADGESLGSHPFTSNRISAPAGMSSVATSHSRWRTRSVHCGRSDGHTSRRAFGAALEGAAKIAGAIGPLKDECSHSPSTNVCELGTVSVASEG